ncbi:MAG: peptidoglycan DD-metalloendopeptidase family protein [Lachnospiraceae bacterium]|nr:peptidoglycan DD-metalloendopeptidase family protein [Lachnospiraceae bacterium]
MKKKKKVPAKNFIRTLLILLLIVVIGSVETVSVAKTTRESLAEAQQKKNELENSLANAQKKVKELSNSKEAAEDKVKELESELGRISAQAVELETQLNSLNQQIDVAKTELADAEAEADAQYDAMKKRIQYTYENRSTTYWNRIFESHNMAEVLNAVEYIVAMERYDRLKLEEFHANIENIQNLKDKLAEDYESVKTVKVQVDEQKQAVSVLANAKDAELKKISANLTDAEVLEKEYQEELQAQIEVLSAIQAAIAAENAANGEDGEGTSSPNASGFIWPCPSSHRITSDFGPRESPTGGSDTYHNGIDIGSPTGSGIVAVQSGTVIVSKYSNSAGNYIVINHGKDDSGNVICSVYMHASECYVSVGQTVNQGDTIAAVGSTGYSTGPHLHFAVTVNGSYVNPWGYVS